MDAIECLGSRRTCRAFKPDMPTDEEISAVLGAALNAPSGMSRFTRHFAVITNTDWLARMNARVRTLAGDASVASNLERNGEKGYSCNYHSPVFIVVSADPAYPTSRDDCACALESMFLAATALGLGSCWINQLGGNNCEKLRDLLREAGVPESHRVYGCCALGYPAAPSAPKKPRTEKITYLK